MVAAAASTIATAADVSWITSGTGSFTTASNWSTGTVPSGTADNAIIRNGGTATLTLAGTFAGPRYTIGQDGAGTLVITGGGTSTTSGISYVGRSQAAGTAAGAGVLLIDGSSTVRHIGSGDVYVGVGSGTRGVSGTMTVAAGSTYAHDSGGTVYIGRSDGSGTTPMTGSLNVAGGTFSVASNELVVGRQSSSLGSATGVVSISQGGSVTVNNWTKFGSDNGANGGIGRLLISDGSFTKGGSGDLVFGNFNGRGEAVQSGGLFTNTAGTLRIGAWGANGVGVYDISSGTLASTTSLSVGSSGGNGTLNVSGGLVRKTGAGDLEAGTGGTGRGTINVSGGLVDVQVGDLAVGAADGAKASLNLSGSGEVRAPVLVLGKAGATTSGTVNLNGGTLRVNQITGGVGAATSAFVFNGGTLAARADQTSFLSGIGSATVAAGGAVVDSQGYSVTIPQTLSGSGGLTKIGAGVLSLTGANTFAGPIAVNAGRLAVTTAATGAGAVTLSASATLGVTVAGGLDTQFTIPSLALGSASGLSIDLASFGNASLAPLNVGGALTTSGAATINFLSSAPSVGTIPLVKYGSLNAFTFTLGTLPAGVLGTLSNNTVNNSIDLVVTSVALPRWQGGVSDVWNANGTANWLNTLTGSTTTFQNGNPALFNDLAAGSTDVQLNSTVLPGTTTFANDTRAYSLAGTGAINGSGGLTKQGVGALSLNTVNGYTGATRLEGGVTTISSVANAGSPSAIGAASADPSNLVFAGGSLAYAGSTASTTRGFSVSGSTSGLEVSIAGAALTFSGNVSAAASQFHKRGPGTLVLAGSANALGSDATSYGIAVDSGTLRLAGSGTVPSSQVSTITGEMRVGSLVDSSAALEVADATLNVSGWLTVGHGLGSAGATATATLSNASVQAGGFRLGYDNGLVNSSSQSFTMTNSTVAVSNEALIANSLGSTSALIVHGASSFSSAGNLILGNELLSNGSAIVMGSGTFAAGDGLYVGDLGEGSLIAQDQAAVSAARLLIGQGGGSSGTMTATGDTRVTASVYAAVGNFGGGTLTLGDRASMAVLYDLNVADRYSSTGSLTIRDSASASAGSVYVAKGANTVATVVVSGGTLAVGSSGGFVVGRNGAGAITVSGSGVVTTGASGLVLASGSANAGNPDEAAAGSGSLDLNGGVLETTTIRKGAGSTASVNLNGGTVRAASGAIGSTFMTGLDNAIVYPGGVTVDTNGQAIAIGQSLADGGGGGLVKVGSGTLSLTGVNTYTGPTSVNAGGLSVQTSSLASGGYTLANGTRLGVMLSGSGTQLSAASLTMTGTAALDFDFSSFGNPSAAPLNVLGGLTAGGPVTLTVSGVQPAVGQFPLIQYGSKTGGGAYSLTPIPGYTSTLFDNGSTIFLDITAIAARQWNGAVGGVPNGVWTVGTTSNWVVPPSTPSTFSNGDAALFNDAATGTTGITISGSVSPSGVTIDNSALAYSFGGSGAISGTGGLVKQGVGTATLSSTNTYTGITTVAGGRLEMARMANGGLASPIGGSSSAAANLVLAGGTLAYTGTSLTVNRGFSTGGATGGGIEVANAAATLSLSGLASGTSALITSGLGTLRLSGSSNSLGSGNGFSVAVHSGTLALAGSGTGPSGQTNAFNGEVLVGAVPGAGGSLVVTDATMNITGFLAIGRGTGDVNAQSSATLTRATVVASGLALGSNNGVTPNLASQSLALTNASFYSGGDTLIGDNAGSTATVTMTGSSVFSSDSGTRIGNEAGAVGAFVVGGSSTFTTAGWLAIGNSGSGSMTVRDHAVVTVPVDFNVADLAGSVGTLTVQDNAAVSAASVYLGKNEAAGSKAVGTVNMAGGTFSASGSDFIIGRSGDGSWVQSGGATVAASEVVLARSGNTTGSLVVSGGSFTQSGTDSGLIVGYDGVGALIVSGSGSVTVAGTQSGLTIGNFGIGSGTVSLDGGNLTVPFVRKAGTAATLTLNGGVLRAGAAARNDFLSGLDAAVVMGGGAIIDTNGVGVTVSQSLTDGGVGGGLTKQGAGILVLAGNNTYTGATTVLSGTLSLSAAASIAASTAVVVGPSAAFDVTSNAGGYAVPATQSVGGNGTVNGGLTIGSGATLAPGMSPGTLTLTQGLTLAGGGNYNWQMLSGTGSAGSASAWDLVVTNGLLTIASTSADPFKINLWTLSGTGPDVSGPAANFDASSNYTWKIASATGGISGFAADKFALNTSATNGTGGFANSLSGGTFSIAQSGNDLNLVFTSGAPSVITINVASGTQTQTQVGYPLLSGATPVVKTGAGTLVLDQANTLTGSTTVQAGVLTVANASSLASSTLAVVAGGTAQVASSLATTVGGLNLAGNGLVDVTTGYVTVAAGLSATELVNEIIAGRAGGTWTGTSGITSSTAAANVALGAARAVGWLANGDGSLAFAYAAPGDSNLDWKVDVLDVANVVTAGKFNTGALATWAEGDFNYDGAFDMLDVADLISTGLYNTGVYNPPAGAVGAVAAVPEPATWAVLVVAGGAALATRARRRIRLCRVM